jgi:dTDP-4-amino-4,6-dideoxygalactose transaminase
VSAGFIPQAAPLLEYQELREEIDAAMRRVLEHGHYVLGPEVSAFESEFAHYIGVPHALGLASGTDAVHLGLRALGVGAGDEVITTPHTAVATAAAIEQCGATPVFADIDPVTFTLDPRSVQRALTSRTKAIVPVHLFGQAADLGPLCAMAAERGLHVLEDCAQAHGARYGSARVGTFGHAAAFSFYPTKNLGAIGDGGMLVTKDPAVLERARSLREYGWRERYISEVSGFNSRLDELQAAILRVKLRYLDAGNDRRRALAAVYASALPRSVVKPVERAGSTHVYHLYVIRHPRRDALRAYLREHGVGTAIHYPVPVHLQPAYRGRVGDAGRCAHAEQAASEILSLPLYPQLSPDAARAVAELIARHDT